MLGNPGESRAGPVLARSMLLPGAGNSGEGGYCAECYQRPGRQGFHPHTVGLVEHQVMATSAGRDISPGSPRWGQPR